MSSVFISYSHADEAWKDRLITQLGVLENEGIIAVWDDRRILGGEEWLDRIQKAMSEARVAVLLVTADFLTSKFIRSEEVPRILKRREKHGLIVIPIIVKPCPWKAVRWLAKLQVRPRDGRPLSGGSEHQIDIDLTTIAEEIHSRIGDDRRSDRGSVSPERGSDRPPDDPTRDPTPPDEPDKDRREEPEVDRRWWVRMLEPFVQRWNARAFALIVTPVVIIVISIAAWRGLDRIRLALSPPIAPISHPKASSMSVKEVAQIIRSNYNKVEGLPDEPGKDAFIAERRLRQAVFLSFPRLLRADEPTIRQAIASLEGGEGLADTFGQDPRAKSVADMLDQIIDKRREWLLGARGTVEAILPDFVLINENFDADSPPKAPLPDLATLDKEVGFLEHLQSQSEERGRPQP